MNVVLLVVAAGLAALIVVVPEEEEAPALEPLTRGSTEEIFSIRIEKAGEETIALRRRDGAWDLVEPLAMDANDFRVNTLLGVLSAPVHAWIDAKPSELHRFGLSSPLARILLNDDAILFGTTEPIHGRRYLLHDGRIALVDDAYFSHLSSSAANYVNPKPLGRDAEGADVPESWRNASATAVRPYEPGLDWSEQIAVKVGADERIFDVARTEYEVVLARPELGIQYHLTRAAGERLLDHPPS